jgi:hypothetical protein
MRARAVAFSAPAVGWTFGRCVARMAGPHAPIHSTPLHHAGADLSLGRSGTAAPPLRHYRRSAQQRSSDAPCGSYKGVSGNKAVSTFNPYDHGRFVRFLTVLMVSN